VCKATPWIVAEGLKCIGGDGDTSDTVMPRLFRESPLKEIWEGAGEHPGAGRATRKTPEALDAFLAEVGSVSELDVSEADARRLVERLALALQRSLLVRYGGRRSRTHSRRGH
jgi:putative acyl-CoA dehydrogenase